MKTDSEIIRDSVRSASAFAELFERHVRPVRAYAFRRVGADAVDDIVSDTFLIAFRKRKGFRDGAESARPWLLGIATKVIHRHREREAKHLRTLISALEQDAGDTEASPTERSDQRVDAQSELRMMAPRIAGLAARDRDTLLLYAWADLSYEEIATALSVPVGTVKSRLNRVRRVLSPARPGHGLSKNEEEVGYGRLEPSA